MGELLLRPSVHVMLCSVHAQGCDFGSHHLCQIQRRAEAQRGCPSQGPACCFSPSPCLWQTSLITPMLLVPSQIRLRSFLDLKLLAATPSQSELAGKTRPFAISYLGYSILETPPAKPLSEQARRRAGASGVWEGPDGGTHALVSSSSTPVTGIP